MPRVYALRAPKVRNECAHICAMGPKELRFPHRQKQSLAMSCACLASLAEFYILEVVFWLFLSKTRHAFQTTAFTELVAGLPLVLRARESSFPTDHSKHWPRIAQGTRAGIACVFLSIPYDIILPTSMHHNCIPQQLTLPVLSTRVPL